MITVTTPIAEKAREIFEKRIKDWLDRNQEAMPFSDVLFEYADIEGYRVDVDGTKATVWAKSKIEFIAGAGELIRQIVKAICKGEKLPERFTVTNRPKYPSAPRFDKRFKNHNSRRHKKGNRKKFPFFSCYHSFFLFIEIY
jgi:hypothetical protein